MIEYTPMGLTVMQARGEVLPAAVCAIQLRPSQPGTSRTLELIAPPALHARAMKRLPRALCPAAGGFAAGRLSPQIEREP